ncbi:serine hydrolase domain-containing protein [Patulibacter defluvii]|uniref:serine hydrolase domain-containing protein n=1 Tax=Patulibacter defluvii TaxID=3095358 RepID=UPI002A74E32F|nr:serine hydrolase domain-containing protein [Patulibacter sp. DM4]
MPRLPCRRSRTLLALVLLAVAAVAAALLLIRGDDPPAYRPPASTAALVARIRAVVPGALRDSRTPGAAIAVVADGRLAWAGGIGRADARRPVTARTAFQAGSLSKTVTAWALRSPAGRRLLPLDEPLDQRLRPWPLAQRPRGITVARLLSHTAGLGVPGYLGSDRPGPLPSAWQSLRGEAGSAATRAGDDRRGPVPIVAPPGREYRYSGGGYTLLQYALERRGGQPFARWMARNALQPLAMDRSRFGWPPAADAAVGHDGAGRPVPGHRYAELAAAGLSTTAGDLGRFLAAVLADPRGIDRPQPATGGHYGLGIERRPLRDGDLLLWHEGVNRGWHARLLLLPRHRLAVAVLTNGDGGGAVADAVERLLVG